MIILNAFLFSKRILFSGLILFSINIVRASTSDIHQHKEHDKPLSHSPKLLKILSVDGGGIRGIIPGTILARLEELTGKPIAQSFEVMAGTSTGGILTLGLNARDPKDEKKVPLYTASDLVDIYTERGDEIFQQSICRKIGSCMGLLSYKYSCDGLNKIAKELLGDLKLSDSITNTLITSYEIEKDEPYFFKSALAKKKDVHNFYMNDIVRATSAAPTYFQPARIKNMEGETFTFIDGGVVLNNPTLSATIHGKNLFPKVTPQNFMVISLGTGNTTRTIPYYKVKNSGGLGWVGKIIPLMMDGASHVVDYQMLHVMPDTEGMKNYFRFQPNIPSDLSEMDNTNPENIKKLKMIAEKSAYKYFDELIQLVAKNIHENRKFSSTGDLFEPQIRFSKRTDSIFFTSAPDESELIIKTKRPKNFDIYSEKNFKLSDIQQFSTSLYESSEENPDEKEDELIISKNTPNNTNNDSDDSDITEESDD